MIACAITLTIATITLFLAWLQSSLPLILISLAGFAGAAALFAWRRRRGGSSGWHEPEAGLPAGLDEESVRQLDEVLDRLQVEAPEDLMAQLKSLKTLLVRIGQQMRGPPDEHFTMDDGMYVRECVRRYLPDSATGYLRVPKGQRGTSLERDGQTAESLLRSQLNLIESELQKRETKLARSAAEHLLRQQRFLEGKASR